MSMPFREYYATSLTLKQIAKINFYYMIGDADSTKYLFIAFNFVQFESFYYYFANTLEQANLSKGGSVWCHEGVRQARRW